MIDSGCCVGVGNESNKSVWKICQRETMMEVQITLIINFVSVFAVLKDSKLARSQWISIRSRHKIM